MTAQSDRDKKIAVIVVAVFVVLWVLKAGLGCASNTPTAPITVTGDAGPIELAQDSTQVVNSWVPFVIIVLGMFTLFMTYLYFDKSYGRFGRRG